jgi:hypothetical protein
VEEGFEEGQGSFRAVEPMMMNLSLLCLQQELLFKLHAFLLLLLLNLIYNLHFDLEVCYLLLAFNFYVKC